MKLSTYLSSKNITSQKFAKQMKVSISSVNKWRILNRTPRATAILKIAKATKGCVTLKDWC